ncbi:MAG: imelysin family protein [Pseudomonadota bacterium]
MRHAMAALCLLLLPLQASADAMLRATVDDYIVPGYAALVQSAVAMEEACAANCAPDDAALRAAYDASFDAWILISNLRFGPTEVDNRGFALAFWPDSRGATQKTVARLLRAEDPVVEDAEAFAKISVAARGYYALERLLYVDDLPGTPAYREAMTGAVIRDIRATAALILADWRGEYGDTFATAGAPGNALYLSAEEGMRQLFTSLTTGLEATSELRLGRPLGTFERPRPTRAEARRSGRSLRHVALSLEGNRALARVLLGDSAPADLVAEIEAPFERALADAAALKDPVFAGVAEPAGRIKVEALQLRVNEVRRVVALRLGPHLGIAAGFNSLDGD